jgi:hypothetical protein
LKLFFFWRRQNCAIDRNVTGNKKIALAIDPEKSNATIVNSENFAFGQKITGIEIVSQVARPIDHARVKARRLSASPKQAERSGLIHD